MHNLRTTYVTDVFPRAPAAAIAALSPLATPTLAELLIPMKMLATPVLTSVGFPLLKRDAAGHVITGDALSYVLQEETTNKKNKIYLQQQQK